MEKTTKSIRFFQLLLESSLNELRFNAVVGNKPFFDNEQNIVFLFFYNKH